MTQSPKSSKIEILRGDCKDCGIYKDALFSWVTYDKAGRKRVLLICNPCMLKKLDRTSLDIDLTNKGRGNVQL